MRIGWITEHDLFSEGAIGGGLAYRRQLLAALRRDHEVDVRHVAVPEAHSFPGKVREKLRLERAHARVHGDRDVWIRDFRTLAFLGRDRTRGRRIAIVHHVDASTLPNRLYNETADRLATHRLKAMDTVVVVSRYWDAWVRRRGVRDVHIIHNALDRARFAPLTETDRDAFRRAHGLSGKPVVYIGNCRPDKGAHLAYDALRGEPCHLVTSGPCYLDLPCRNLQLSYDDYLQLLRIADVAVLLSQFPEGWCISAHEAMMCGTPVIGSGRGGMRELLEGGGQIVCEDRSRVASEVRFLLADRSAAAAMGARGAAFAQQFTLQRFEDAWRELLSPDGARQVRP